ncbi:hypothetical protein DOY81_008930 [Sarcophaga bullata]|nr:hypothetical protein DOY81_008930 [Sarcophaga bullata]
MNTCQKPCKYGKLKDDQTSQNMRSLIQQMTAINHTAVDRNPKR